MSDFDDDGLEAEVLALFVAGNSGDEPALYNSASRWTASGSLLEGSDIGIGEDEEAIVRVMYLESYGGGEVLRLNDAGELALSDYFGEGGDGNDLTISVQTSDGVVSFPASGGHSAGGNYVNFNIPNEAGSLIADIGEGDRFILALTRPRAQLSTQEPASTDATLSGLSLSGIDFGTFASSTTDYIAGVGNDVTETTVTPTTNDDGATYAVKLGGVTDSDGTVSLAVGENVIAVEVTAEDDSTVKTYTVTVTRAEPPSTDATLSDLALSGVTLAPAFDPATTDYTADVGNDVTQTTVTPMTNDDGASYAIKLGGVTDADGVIALSVGENVITVEVTAENGSTVKTYTVTVEGPVAQQQNARSTDATLSGLALIGITLSPTFDSATTDYTGDVGNAVTETTVTPTTNNDGADYAIKLGGVTDADGVIPLSVGSNVIIVEVTAEDASITKTYTVKVTRAEPASTDATLSDLSLSGVTLSPAFDPATTGYTADVGNDVTETTVTPTTNDDGASYAIKLGGVTDADGVIALAEGSNVIAVEVTAEDGSTAKTYTVTVTRAEPCFHRRHAERPVAGRRHPVPGLRPGNHRLHGRRGQRRGRDHRHSDDERR